LVGEGEGLKEGGGRRILSGLREPRGNPRFSIVFNMVYMIAPQIRKCKYHLHMIK
jgi:hypothetical protein